MERDKEICVASVVNLPKKMIAGPSWFMVKFPAGTHRDQLGPSGPGWEFNQMPAGVSYHFLLGMQCSMWFEVGS